MGEISEVFTARLFQNGRSLVLTIPDSVCKKHKLWDYKEKLKKKKECLYATVNIAVQLDGEIIKR